MANKSFKFMDIYNMSEGERKKNNVSLEIRKDSNDNDIATWCQVIDGVLIIKQAVADVECKHFTEGVGMASVVRITDMSLINRLFEKKGI